MSVNYFLWSYKHFSRDGNRTRILLCRRRTFACYATGVVKSSSNMGYIFKSGNEFYYLPMHLSLPDGHSPFISMPLQHSISYVIVERLTLISLLIHCRVSGLQVNILVEWTIYDAASFGIVTRLLINLAFLIGCLSDYSYRYVQELPQ